MALFLVASRSSSIIHRNSAGWAFATSYELALQDWMGTAGLGHNEDAWPRRWAEAYVAFARWPKPPWLRAQGVRFFPIVGWAERGGYGAIGHGNSVPRFHLTWGTGPGVLATLYISQAIIAEATLSFLGLGTQPPEPRLGGMLTAARGFIDSSVWMSLFPGLAIFITVLGFNFLGDGLRDILDPRIGTNLGTTAIVDKKPE